MDVFFLAGFAADFGTFGFKMFELPDWPNASAIASTNGERVHTSGLPPKRLRVFAWHKNSFFFALVTPT